MTKPDTAQSHAGAVDRPTLVALIDASRAINEERDPAGMCARVVEHASRVLDAEGASVLLHDTLTEELVFHTVVGLDTAAVRRQRFPSDKGIAGQVLRTRRPVLVNDVTQNKNFYPGIDDLTKTTTRSLLAVPLVHRDETVGVVEVVNRHGGDFRSEDLDVLQVLANLVAGAARNVMRIERLDHDNRGLRAGRAPARFIGGAPAFRAAVELCERVAPTRTTVLLQGESGTGKEMAAQAIHAASPRVDRAFIGVNCAALPESLIESELFGHEKGAFTGATRRAIGRFELADGGTLLLDEIGELPAAMQAKLLRVLESREITRIGGADTIHCDVRIIAATNRDLRERVDAGEFREDLFYRLGVFPIELPPLRERMDDLPLLVEHLLAQVAPSLGDDLPSVRADAMAHLQRYRWPGNVRELRNVIERAAVLADGEITPDHLPAELTDDGSAVAGSEQPASALEASERELILEALQAENWNQSAAARRLGITRDILRYRVKRYRLAP
jgi:Nif-specific regulatory protein